MSKTMRVYDLDIATADTKVVIHINRNSADNLIISGNTVKYLDYTDIRSLPVQSFYIDDDTLHVVLYEDETETKEAEGE